MAKYDPISAHFASRPSAEETHRLKFDELDGVIGTPLPKTARTDRTWWANTQSSTHARCWLSAGWKVDKVDLGAGAVDFVRRNGVSAKKSDRRASFVRLHEFFKALPSQQEQLALSIDDIETITQRKLRRTPLHDRTWWANSAAYEPAKFWMSAGWRVEGVYLKARLIVFRRKGTAVLETIRHWVKRMLEPDGLVGGPDARMLAAWIKQCRRVCWFFEGTVLFERSGVSMNALDESERSEVEEDYEVCKRELTRYKLAVPEPAMAMAVGGEHHGEE